MAELEDTAIDEAAMAQQAAEAAAARFRRQVRGPAEEEPKPQPSLPSDMLPSDANPDLAGEEAGLRERFRLNQMDQFYRGTLTGIAHLNGMASLVQTPDAPDTLPEIRKRNDRLRANYRNIVADLARYDMMAPFGDTFEAGAALAGVLTGALPSPESFIGAPVKGATMAVRAGKVAFQQAMVQLGTDPLVQIGSMSAGVQKEYEPMRTALAPVVGAVIGGGLHIGGELITNSALKRTVADLSAEDPSFRRADIEPTPVQPETVTSTKTGEVAEGAPAPVDIKVNEGRAVDGAPIGTEATPRAEVATGELGTPRDPTLSPASNEAAKADITPATVAVPQAVVHRVTTPSGQAVDVKPIVMEARDLVTSADGGYDAALQPRDRDRAASQQQIREIAGNLEPERLGFSAEADRGAPIIGPDNMVESGNGRVMAIRQAYEENGEAAQRYRAWIESQGIDISGFKEPVIVRQRVTELSPEDRVAFTVGANQAATLTFSAPERALADARLVSAEALDLIRNPDDLGAAANRNFVRSFVGRLPQAEQGAMMNAEGGLSSEGLTRVRNAVLARAYGDAPVLSRISEATSDEVKSISNALVSVAPHWAKLRSDVEAGLVRADIEQTGALVEAVTRTAELRGKGQKLDTFLAQQDAFERVSPVVEDFMRMFYDPTGRRAAGANRISDALRFYAEEGRKVSDGGFDLGLPPVTAADLQRLAREKASGSGQPEATLFLRGSPRDVAGDAAGGGQVPGQAAGGSGSDAAGAGAVGDRAGLGGASGDELALAARRGGTGLAMERARPAAGTPSTTSTTGTALVAVPKDASPEQAVAIRSLHQQAIDLADAIGFPLREGRNKQGTLGTYNTQSGVVRVKEVPDFEVVTHEAGHAIEAKVGNDLTDLTNTFVRELGPLDYDQNLQRANEGFAEWVRRYIGNPAHAEKLAPGFTIAFRDLMARQAPDLLAAIDKAGAAYRAYIDAPSIDAVAAVRRSQAENPKGFQKVVATVREEGLPAVTKTVVQKGYTGLFDDKAPVTRAVREIGTIIRNQTGELVDLKAVDDPAKLIRLFERSHQAAVRDMLDGVRPYHETVPQGPSLTAALEKATGGRNSGGWGKWDPEKKAAFSNYLIARMSDFHWQRFKRGEIPNPPAAFSQADARIAMAESEAANKTFREAADMVHAWTRELLRKQLDAGLIGRDLYDKLVKWDFYVPMMRDMRDKPLAGGDPAKGGAADRVADTVQRFRGSSRDVIDPIESLMTQALLVNRASQHNDLIRSFVALSRRAKGEGGRFVETIPAMEAKKYTFDLGSAVERAAKQHGMDPDEIKVLTGAMSDLFGEDPIIGSFFRMEPAGKRGEPIVFYKEGGELRAARFMSGEEGHALYETVTALPQPLTDAWSMLIGATTSTLRAGIVTNPMFALTNYIRDQFAVALLRNDYIPIISGLKGLHAEVTQGESAILYGVGGGMSGGASITPAEAAIRADVDALAKKGYLVNRLTSFKGLTELAAVTEAGTRNSVFAKVFAEKKRQGLSDYEAMIEAAFTATDVLDFSRHGSHTELIRRYIPFLNAWLQGNDKARRTMAEPVARRLTGEGDVFTTDPAEFNNALASATKVFGLLSVLGAGWAALNAEKEAYRDASPQIKGTHVVIPLGNKVILAPKPFELGIGFTMGEYAYQKWAQDDPRAAGQFMTAMWDSMTSANPLQDIPLLKQYFELKSGKNLFTGRDIVPETLQRKVAAEQYTDKTSALAKQIGKTIGVSPIKVDYAIGSTFGLWGRDIMALSSGMDPNAPAQSWEDRVFLRRLLKDPARSSDVTTKFWDFMGQTTGKYNQNTATYDDMIKKFRDDEARAFLDRLPANEKAFVVMKSAADEDGKPAFSADQKRMHPLQRAYDAVTLLNGLRRELNDNAFKTFADGKQISLSPEGRRDLIENVRELAQMEMRNGLVIMKEPGYDGRPLFNVQGPMDKIRAISPQVADEIVTRYATAKIYRTEDVARAYPTLKSALLRDGSEADLDDLAADAQSEGYEFGSERVKKPQKRRTRIAPITAPPPN